MIPRPALILGLAGVLPFAAAVLAPLAVPTSRAFAAPALILYGIVILSFMSGCIWAFAARENDWVGYGLSTLPALYGFFLPPLLVMGGIATLQEVPLFLAVGFLMLLGLDWRAQRLGQTPPWWMRLRLLLTALVVACLITGVFL
jgi:hypothetical protein